MSSFSFGKLGFKRVQERGIGLGLQEPSLSVMMPRGSIPSFLAKARHHGSVTHANFSDLPVIGAKDVPQTLRKSGQKQAWNSHEASQEYEGHR